MGRLEIYEFVFGGKVMLVINENKLDFYYCCQVFRDLLKLFFVKSFKNDFYNV